MLGIPQFCIAGIFASFGSNLGPIDILVLVAGFLLLFKDQYPKDLFDLVLGLMSEEASIAGGKARPEPQAQESVPKS